jgi:serine/threonine-protein kinase
MAEADDIASIPAFFRSNRRLEPGIVSEAVDKIGRVGERAAAGDERRVHAAAVNPAAVSGLRTIILNGSLTMKNARIARRSYPTYSVHTERGLGGMSDVFVSYKAEDRRRVKPLVDALESEGFSVWWDEQIGGGATWRHAIEAELNSAKCVIVAWSKRSVGEGGTFVQDEATRAQQRHVYVPVLIDKVHLPLGFGETQALPLVGWKGDRGDARYQAILASVRRITGSKSRRPASAAPIAGKTGVDRRAVLAGGAVATVAVVGIGGWTFLKPSSASAASDSIAVLPFANLSGDPAQAYFSDGVAEEIRSSLARLPGIKVVGRTSSEAVRDDDAQTAAKKLDVASILTGSVRQSASTIRISAELVDGTTGMDRWSQDYDRSPGDAIKIQTDIAENVASALSAALGGAAKAVVSVGGTQNPDAQRLFIQAGALTEKDINDETASQAFDLLDSAIALDPNYAAAYARKSGILTAYANSYAKSAQELAKDRTESLRLAQTALKIAPDLAQAHMALAGLYSSNLQMGPAYAEAKRAIELAPGDAFIVARYANLAGDLGHDSEALAAADKSIALDPLNTLAYNLRLRTLYSARQYADVIRAAQELERKSADSLNDKAAPGDALVLLGRNREAQVYFGKMAPDFWSRLTGEAIIKARSGDRAGAERKLAALQEGYKDAASYQYGQIYAQLGDKDRAFANLEHGFEIKDAGLLGLKTDPMMDPIRSDPRFAALIRKMNFPA